MSTSPMDVATLSAQDNFITRLAEKVGAKATVATVFGEPITRNGTTVVPVARARFGFGGGGGQGTRQAAEPQEGQGFGGGGGMMVKPAGYIVIRDNDVRYHSIDAPFRVFAAIAAGFALSRMFSRRSS